MKSRLLGPIIKIMITMITIITITTMMVFFKVDSKLSSLREVESRLRERLLELEQSEERLQQR